MFNGRHVDAEKHFETAIVLNPNLYEPYYFYGRACMSAGNTEKAARQFMQAADINPSGYEAPGFLGQAYLAMGRTEAAQKALAIFGSFRTAAAGLAGAFVFTVFRFAGNVFTSFTSGSLGVHGQARHAAAPLATRAEIGSASWRDRRGRKG